MMQNRPKSGMTPHMNNKPKPVVHPKIFNVNILILVQEALGNKKIPTAMSCGGGGVHGGQP